MKSVWALTLATFGPVTAAQAGVFDDRGVFRRDGPGTGFEEGEFEGLSGLFQARGVVAISDIERIAAETSDEALEGESALALKRNGLFNLVVDLGTISGDASNRRVRVQLWQKRRGARLRPQVLWRLEVPGEAPFTVGALILVPTGRVTSDGWEEWSSAPFDMRLGDRLTPVLLLQDAGGSGEPFGPLAEQTALVDAIEIIDLGPAEWSGTTCRVDGSCRFGRPIDPAIEEGPSFGSDEHRRQYVARRAFEWATFLGHRRARELQDQTSADFARLAEAPDNDFWIELGRIIDQTEDGHAQRPIVTGASTLAPGVCLHLGEADLLPGSPRRPIVFRSAPSHPASSVVGAGDVLVAIDGEPVEDWLARRRDELPFSADPRVREFAVIPQLLQRVVREGRRLDFLRCALDGSCEPVELDYGELAEPIWSNQVPSWARASLPCDPRFERRGEISDIARPDHVDVRQEGTATVLRINATTGPGFGDFEAWTSEVDQAFVASPATMVLDHRRGDGGSFLGLHYLTRPFFSPGDGPINVVFPWLFDEARAPALRAALAGCSRALNGGAFECGGAQWITPELAAPNAPNAGLATSTKLAILTGLDVSGNDWLTDHLRRRRPNTRVFGPAPTFGAFGEVVGLSTHDMGFVGPRIQWTGGLVAAGELDPLTEFLDGDGVPPDVVVFQKQSDAIRGIDTQLQEALTWLESN